MNTGDGTFSSIYGLCITGFLSILSGITLNTAVGWFAIIAAVTTIAVNAKNFFKKDKNK